MKDYKQIYSELNELVREIEHKDDTAIADIIRDALDVIWFSRLEQESRDEINSIKLEL